MSEAASWAVAGVCLVVSIVYFDELKAAVSPFPQVSEAPAVPSAPTAQASAAHNSGSGDVVELKAGAYGHYHTLARINGREIDVLVDTGASFVALTYEDAERGGIFVSDHDFKYQTQTANGIARVALVTIDRVSIGDIMVRNVQASVHERGKLGQTLLGMSFLGKLQRAEMSRGRLILEN